MVKSPPAMQKTQVRALGREDPLEKGMATHSSILAWRIPWVEAWEAHGVAESDMTEQLTHSHLRILILSDRMKGKDKDKMTKKNIKTY